MSSLIYCGPIVVLLISVFLQATIVAFLVRVPRLFDSLVTPFLSFHV